MIMKLSSIFRVRWVRKVLTMKRRSMVLIVLMCLWLAVLFQSALEFQPASALHQRLVKVLHLNGNETYFGNVPRSSFTSTFRCDIPVNRSKYHGHNLLCDPIIQFDKNFKNPCWYEKSKLRCLPYFFLIGVKKTSTSDLFYRISRHPDYAGWGNKEAQFFARLRFNSANHDNISTYVDQFDRAAKYIEKNADENGRNLKSITGEASPSNLHLNLHWQYLPENEGLDEPRYVILDYIKHFLPQSKIIISFRDPVDRMYSDYYHEYGRLQPKNSPSPFQFHDVAKKGVNLYNDCFRKHSLRYCIYNSEIINTLLIQMQLGIYHFFWEELIRVFPRNQILTVQNKDRNGNVTLSRVFEFLGMETLPEDKMLEIANVKQVYARQASFKAQGPMLNITRKLLDDFYTPFNQKMAMLTGDDTFLYRSGYSG